MKSGGSCQKQVTHGVIPVSSQQWKYFGLWVPAWLMNYDSFPNYKLRIGMIPKRKTGIHWSVEGICWVSRQMSDDYQWHARNPPNPDVMAALPYTRETRTITCVFVSSCHAIVTSHSSGDRLDPQAASPDQWMSAYLVGFFPQLGWIMIIWISE